MTMTLNEILRLEDAASSLDGFGPTYPWGGLYGGQIVAQALLAAGSTVDEGFSCHSLRAYFIRRGIHHQLVHYETDLLRDGRSYCTRRVVAHQGADAILNLEASFARPESSVDLALAHVPPGIPSVEELEMDSWTETFQRALIPDSVINEHRVDGEGRAMAWMRANGDIPDSRLIHQAALAFISDDLPTDAVVRAHPLTTTAGEDVWAGLFSASLDHTIWFHRDFSVTDWMLHDFSCHTYVGGRGLAIGRIFDAGGHHVATVAQEVLLRLGREEANPPH